MTADPTAENNPTILYFICQLFVVSSFCLVGLKYAVEVAKSVDDPNPVYYCSICDDYFNSSIKLRHFTGLLHRKIVAVRFFLATAQTIPYRCTYKSNATNEHVCLLICNT